MNPLTGRVEGVIDRFCVFDCAGETCVGVLSKPLNGKVEWDIGVVIVVGGPQYRAGSHRQFVLLGRALAGAGIPTLRFDYRGMGDSAGEPRTFESIEKDLAAAIDSIQRETRVPRVVVWGLCDAASAALMYSADDPRVAGIVALNPWARSPQIEATTRLRHYYLRRFFSLAFWSKVLSGKFDAGQSADAFVGDIRGAARGSPAAETGAYLQRVQEGWSRFRRPTLFILSGGDLTAREFETWVDGSKLRADLLHATHSQVSRVAEADHTFSKKAWRDAVSDATIEWIQGIAQKC